MKASKRRIRNSEHKGEIREKYKGIDPSEIEVIPANEESERHCGDVLAHKTYTPDFKTHKAVKNEGKLPKYRKRDHHEAIVSRDVYNAAQLIRASGHYKRKKHTLPVMSVIEDGILRGYVPIDRNWEGFSPEEYQKACESIGESSKTESVHMVGQKLNMRGYQRVSSLFFPSNEDGRIRPYNGVSCAGRTSGRLNCRYQLY